MSKGTILVVEDESFVALYTKKCLEKLGFAVSAIATSGEEALRRAREKKPDLVLMDIYLEGEIDGATAAREIHFELDVPVVYLTGYTDEQTLSRAKAAEPFGYIVKPYEPRELQTTIETALHQYHASKLRMGEAVRRLAAGIADDMCEPAQSLQVSSRQLKRAFGDLEKVFESYANLKKSNGDDSLPPELFRTLQETIESVDLESLKKVLSRAIDETVEGVERVAGMVETMKAFSSPEPE
jgi:CheY-like chemotaxis protein